jgi:hypothetical protein
MRIRLVCTAALCILSSQAFAAGEEAAIRSTFIEPWMQALQSKDPARVMRFVHPLVLRCINPQNREIFEGITAEETSYDLKGGYRIAKIAPMTGPMPEFLPADGFPIPVAPTYEVDVEAGGIIFVRYLAPVNGSWYEVFPCPNEKGVAFFHEQMAAGVAQKKRAQQLASELKDPLLDELKSLIKQRQFIDAIKRYQAVTGVDLTTAKMVIDVVRSGL